MLRATIKGGSYGEQKGTAPGSSGRDHQGGRHAVRRPVRDGRGESSGRLPPNASRYPGGAQTPVRSHVPEGVPPLRGLAGSVDAVTSSLRLEEGRAKQKGYGARCAD